MEPLFDLQNRIVAVGTGSSTSAVADALLRFHAAKAKSKAVTLYVVGAVAGATPLPAGDALLLIDVLRSLAPPIRTVGFGLLTGWQNLLLAAGTPGQRYLLARSLVAVEPLEWTGLTLPRYPLGLQGHAASPALMAQQLQQQLDRLLGELNLAPEIFKTPRLLNASEAIEHHFADQVYERPLIREFPNAKPTIANSPQHHEPHP